MQTKLLKKPEWLKIKLETTQQYREVATLIRDQKLNTVCKSAHCPNVAECWGRGTATFMILGDICARGCRFCAINHGQPGAIDTNEPKRLAEAAKTLKLKWVVVTSVTRDDLQDGGASHFAEVIKAIRLALPNCGVEILVPDFKGKSEAVDIICRQPPDILNHNIETVPRLYKQVRPGANYQNSLDLLKQFANRGLITKSGLMVGIGETIDEVKEVIVDLYNHDCRSLTIGQYLVPEKINLPVERYVPPDDFQYLKEFAYSCGFEHVASGPLVRSSYMAEKAKDVFKLEWR